MPVHNSETAAFERLRDRILVSGALRAVEGTRQAIVDPATERVVGSLVETQAKQIDEAVDFANAAHKGWARRHASERAGILHAMSNAIKANADAIARLITLEMGKPLRESLEEIAATAPVFDYFAELALHDAGRVVGSTAPDQLHFTRMEPLGVSVHIVPYNYPVLLLAWGLAASLAAGNAAIVKPSELTTASTLAFVELLQIAEPGLVQVLTGGADVGRRLVEHAGTHVVAFTGSVNAGKAIAVACAATFKRYSIEASGSDPFIVLPSADLDAAAKAATIAGVMNCGQVCTGAERFYVHHDIHDAFVERLADNLAALKIGPGILGADLGPLVNARARKRHEQLVGESLSQGARLAHGGGRPRDHDRGWFVEPSLLVDCRPDMALFAVESFSPIVPVVRVGSFDEAIMLANRSAFGLGATVFTEDLSEAMSASEKLECGIVAVNTAPLDNLAAPFGGRKLSGVGAQLGPQGLDAYRAAKFTMLAYGRRSA